MMAGRRLRFPRPQQGTYCRRDPVMLPVLVKGGGWALGCQLVMRTPSPLSPDRPLRLRPAASRRVP